jgi:enoyl-CoA hydratase/carnithine racemase
MPHNANELEITVRDGVQTFRFNRPEKKNALLSHMYVTMREAFDRGDQDPAVVAHLFIGSGGVFSAGNDIGEFAQRAQGKSGLGAPVLDFIRHLPRIAKPMIAAVDGLAVGIGTTLLFHCDLVYATPSASLRTPFLDLGLVPEAGSSLLAPQRMGYARAFEMLVLGEPFSAERAREAGIVNAIVPADQLEATALAAAARLARKAPEALALSRRLMRGDVEPIVARVDEEAKIFAARLSSPEAREAFAAFMEKRAPDFTKLTKSTT